MLLKKLLLFIFTEYVDNIYDYDLNHIGFTLIYPAWVLRGFLIYLSTFVLFPIFILHMKYKNDIDLMKRYILM
jgi:hypothetical protein